jgi:hypothetical protein
VVDHPKRSTRSLIVVTTSLTLLVIRQARDAPSHLGRLPQKSLRGITRDYLVRSVYFIAKYVFQT